MYQYKGIADRERQAEHLKYVILNYYLISDPNRKRELFLEIIGELVNDYNGVLQNDADYFDEE